MNLCKTLWESYDALKQAHAEAEMFLREGNALSLARFQQSIEKLSKAKKNYNDSLYTKLPDGREIYTLDYLSFIRICNDNDYDLNNILSMQGPDFLLDKRINSLTLDMIGLKKLNTSDFTALTDLNCSMNQITSIDVSGNKALKVLICEDNQITSLSTISHLQNLVFILARNNPLDNASKQLVESKGLKG